MTWITENTNAYGAITGYSVHGMPAGEWNWHAYGLRGNEHGEAKSRHEALEAALDARRRLSAVRS